MVQMLGDTTYRQPQYAASLHHDSKYSFVSQARPMRTAVPDLWQVNVTGPFETLKQWADAQQSGDEPLWLALSVFEEVLPDGRLQALFAEEDEARAFASTCKFGDGYALLCTPLQQENWIAKSLEGLPVVHAGRFFVHGAHHHIPDDAALISILIEAGEAFGTGHHGTTKGCLLAFDDMLANTVPTSVLDIGTGAGTLAIAAAKVLPQAEVLATDIDPIAIAVTRENAIINGLGDRVEMVVADGFSHACLADRQFALVFANILALPLIAMAGGISAAVSPDGTLILSGILDSQSHSVRAAYEEQGLVFSRDYKLDEWRVLVLQKPT